MRQGENVRRLNSCLHEFHSTCVDNWFLQRSVLCPVCRHDIRDPTPVVRSPIIRARPNALQHIPPLNPLNPEEEENSPTSSESTNTPRLRTRD